MLISSEHKQRQKGFTIVELLIVVVVIAILAAITIIAFSGVTQRANNSKRISEAGSLIKLIKLYRAQYDVWPSTAATIFCAGDSSLGACNNVTTPPYANVTFEPLNTELRKVGTLPTISSAPVQISGAKMLGPVYQYRSSNTVDGVAGVKLIMILYWLEGQSQNCSAGAPIVTGTAGTYTTSTTGYTSNSGNGTLCRAILTD